MIKDRDTYFCESPPSPPKAELPSRRPSRWQFRLSSLLVLMVMLGGAFVWLRDYVHNRPIAWVPYSAEILDRQRSEGHIVLVFINADWDLTSSFNRRHALETRKVRAFLRDQGIIAMEADFTNQSPEVDALLKSLDALSVPLIVIYPAEQAADPVKLFDKVTEDHVLEALRAAQRTRQ